jgi:hypothetical protein
MKNTKITRPLKAEDEKKYFEFSQWCNENGCLIKDDNPQYYYCEKFIPPEPTIQDKINELESRQTPRLLREALKGDETAIAKINDIDA